MQRRTRSLQMDKFRTKSSIGVLPPKSIKAFINNELWFFVAVFLPESPICLVSLFAECHYQRFQSIRRLAARRGHGGYITSFFETKSLLSDPSLIILFKAHSASPHLPDT